MVCLIRKEAGTTIVNKVDIWIYRTFYVQTVLRRNGVVNYLYQRGPENNTGVSFQKREEVIKEVDTKKKDLYQGVVLVDVYDDLWDLENVVRNSNYFSLIDMKDRIGLDYRSYLKALLAFITGDLIKGL